MFHPTMPLERENPGQRQTLHTPLHNNPGKPGNRADPDGRLPEVVTVQLDGPVTTHLNLPGAQ